MLDTARSGDGTTDEDLQTLLRLRFAARVGFVAPLVSAVVNTLALRDERYPERIASLLLVAGICALALVAIRTRWAKRHAAVLATGTVLAVGCGSLWGLTLAGRDVDVLVGVVVATMVAAAFVLPRGPWPQTLVALSLAAGYAWLAPWSEFGDRRAVNIAITLAVGVALSISASYALDRQRQSVDRLIAALERVSRTKSDFLSTVSHEIRTPMNVLIGYVEMLRDPETGEAERQDLLARVATASQQIAELVEGTLAIERLEDEAREIRLERVALSDLWRAAARACDLLPRRPGVALEWSDDVPAASVVSDPRRFAIVVRNLVSNALKFTERGSVRASLALVPGALEIAIADTGVGIAPEDQARIFQKFEQASDRGLQVTGIGLGLYIAHRFVTHLGGSIDIRSAVGRGSTFTVRLPLEPAAGASPGPRAAGAGDAPRGYGLAVSASGG